MQKKAPQHDQHPYYVRKDGTYYAHGKDLRDIANIAGSTPFYVYNRDIIEQKVNHFRAFIPDRIKLHYAIKANPMPALVCFAASLVDGLDVASQKELRAALASGISAKTISFAGPAKQDSDLRAAIASGITLNIESEGELQRAIDLGQALGQRPQIAIRVNPDFELKTSGMKMGGGPKQFGIDAEIVPDIIRSLPDSVDYVGLHIFSGSQNLRPDALIDAHQKTFALAARIQQDSGRSIHKLNLGGGFGIPYFPGETCLDLTEIGENLSALLEQYQTEFNDTELVIELGRYLVGECGLYVTSVVDKKESRGTTYLTTDGGLHHHLSNSGNFGQVIRKNYPVDIVQLDKAAPESENELVTVVGPLCTPLDTLADKMTLPQAKPGDLVIIFQSGAYGATASPINFLSQPEMIEVFI
ncbi:diaminopimelate decarboxylase [Oleiphilus messinensis]|uniref:Diaminopimelate decarboxylase n=1 Tax=Oleiphilus messinensis TaxID=141451 RepID=A0A1Y0I6S9_9GAMM|nr:pyridoxal-dependent decarboxylase, exosortase A system-associated [Oleiphilus messinensis]ARU56207.1 diaminopimelate decarboxylase [Oleiphilus messinensis]